MNILYVHGFGSNYDTTSPKIKMLEELGTVVGKDVDYSSGFKKVYAEIKDFALGNDIDLIVGTSLGGHTASHVGTNLGIPFVAINPAITPSVSLKDYLGTHNDFVGSTYTLREDIVDAWPSFLTGGCGCIIVEMGDEICDANETITELTPHYEVNALPNGSHIFDDLKSGKEIISKFTVNNPCGYGG